MTMLFAAMLLSSVCVSAIVQVDNAARARMLPQAAPVAALERIGWQQYHLELMGRSFHFSTSWATALGAQLEEVLRTPPAQVRLAYQLRAYLTGEVPRNSRGDPRVYKSV